MMMNNISNKNLIIVSLILHLLAAYFVTGWYHADEQSCILEYVNFKLGLSSNPCFLNFNSDNYIVSGVKFRSWIQPSVYYILANILNFFSINDPFTYTFVYRLFSSIIGFYSVHFFYKKTYLLFKHSFVKKFYFFLIYFFWFNFLFHTRTSAENFSTSFFLIALALIISNLSNNNIKLFFSIGIIFGLSFVFRYNIGVAIFFVCLWYLIFNQLKLLSKINLLFLLSVGLFLVFSIEQIINIWGFYNPSIFLNPDLNIINFLFENLTALNFLKFGSQNDFYSNGIWAISPLYHYFELILLEFFPPLSIIIIICILYFWIKNPKDIIVWATLPYFIIHSFIAYKELRYIFPVLALSPYFVAYTFDNFNYLLKNIRLSKNIITIFFIFNLFGIIYFTFFSLRPELHVLKNIYYNEDIKKILILNTKKNIDKGNSINPFNIENITQNYYFNFKNFLLYNNNKIIYSGLCSSGTCINIEQNNIYNDNSIYYDLIIDNNNLKKNKIKLVLKLINNVSDINLNNIDYVLTVDNEIINKIDQDHDCKVISNEYPLWISKISFNDINKRSKNLALFKC